MAHCPRSIYGAYAESHRRRAADLLRLRDGGPKPYLRERAAAILELADGWSGARIARDGLLRPRRPNTVYAWLRRCLLDGACRTYDDGGARAQTTFSPPYPDAAEATEGLQRLVRHQPRLLELDQSRWTLAAIREACLWMHGLSLGGVAQSLDRLGVSWQRERAAIDSPNRSTTPSAPISPSCAPQVAAAPERLVLCYLDEVTIERQPTVAASYAARGGKDQPRARLSHASNTLTRLVATLTQSTPAARPCRDRPVALRIEAPALSAPRAPDAQRRDAARSCAAQAINADHAGVVQGPRRLRPRTVVRRCGRRERCHALRGCRIGVLPGVPGGATNTSRTGRFAQRVRQRQIAGRRCTVVKV